jgi:hypothetical protein
MNMTFEEYVERAIITESISARKIAKALLPIDIDARWIYSIALWFIGLVCNKTNIRLLHAALGLNTEVAEMLSAYVAGFKNGSVDTKNLKEEIGDAYWYLAIAYDAFFKEFGGTIDEIESEDYYESTHLIIAVGEYTDIVKRRIFYDGYDIKPAQLLSCLDEIHSILDALCKLENFRKEEVLRDNIEKLKKRYGKKFTGNRALNRDTVKELDHIQ